MPNASRSPADLNSLPVKSLIRALLLLATLLLPRVAAAQEPPQAPILRVEAAAHTAPVRRMATDASGRVLATVSDDKTLRLWALPEGTPLAVLRPPIGEGEEGELSAVALTPDGSKVFAGGLTGREWDGVYAVYLFDTATGRLLARLPGLPAPVQHLAVSADGARLAGALGGRAGIRIWDARDGRLLSEDSVGWDGPARMVAFDAAGRLAASSADGKIRLYAPNGRRIAERAPVPGGRPYGIAWSPDGALLAVGFEDRLRVEILAAADLHTVLVPDMAGLSGEGTPAVAWAGDGQGGVQLHAGGYAHGVAAVAPGAPGFVIRRWSDFGLGPARDIPVARDAIIQLLAVPGGGMVFATADPGWGRLAGDGSVAIAVSSPAADFRNTAAVLAASADGQRVRFLLRPDAAPMVFDAQAGRLTQGVAPEVYGARQESARLRITDWRNQDRPKLNGRPLPLGPGEYSRSLAILPNEQSFLLGTDTHLRLFDASGRMLDQVPMPGAVWGVVALNGIAVVALGDGTIRWFEATDRLAERGALFVHADGRRWVVWTPEGLFDHAAEGGQELVGVHLNNGRNQTPEWASFRQAYRALYAPTELRARLRGDAAPAEARMADLGEVRARIGRLPTLSPGEACAVTAAGCVPLGWGGSELPEGATGLRVTYATADRGLGLGPLDIMVNDRIAVRAAAVAGQTSVEVPLDPGPNHVSARLYADDRSLFAEGPGFDLRRAGAVRAPAGQGRLILVAVGVDAYALPELRLRYAVADAHAVADVLKSRAAGVFSDVVSTVLTDADATRANILAALANAAQITRPEDTFVLYLAGHGVRSEPDRHFLFLPQETASIADWPSLRRSALDEGTLVAALARIRARDGFLFIDTCHAGQVTIDSLAALGNETGRFLLAASTSVQEALDSYDDRNGVFAVAVREAMSGRAAMDGDGRISALALGEWVTRRVPQLAAEKHHQQDAVFRTARRDLRSFPMGAMAR
ncbi:WD40 repeat protein [Humitalea rosea]|uniref:WD40 repeat protein n=1 Tax=Humitalea rosea TaxID=990373 RepID=A0A2W7IHK7_9PROT|nr:WD40 repeat protein [Humitalea rosea]